MILSYLDAKSLSEAEHVCKEWLRVISDGMLWKKLIERKITTDPLWKGLSEQRGWIKYLHRNSTGEPNMPHSFYRSLYPNILKDIKVSFTRVNYLVCLLKLIIILANRGKLEKWEL